MYSFSITTIHFPSNKIVIIPLKAQNKIFFILLFIKKSSYNHLLLFMLC